MEDRWRLVSQELSLHGSFAEFKLDAWRLLRKSIFGDVEKR
jgi:hypothetical protein